MTAVRDMRAGGRGLLRGAVGEFGADEGAELGDGADLHDLGVGNFYGEKVFEEKDGLGDGEGVEAEVGHQAGMVVERTVGGRGEVLGDEVANDGEDDGVHRAGVARCLVARVGVADFAG